MDKGASISAIFLPALILCLDTWVSGLLRWSSKIVAICVETSSAAILKGMSFFVFGRDCIISGLMV